MKDRIHPGLPALSEFVYRGNKVRVDSYNGNYWQYFP